MIFSWQRIHYWKEGIYKITISAWIFFKLKAECSEVSGKAVICLIFIVHRIQSVSTFGYNVKFSLYLISYTDRTLIQFPRHNLINRYIKWSGKVIISFRIITHFKLKLYCLFSRVRTHGGVLVIPLS